MFILWFIWRKWENNLHCELQKFKVWTFLQILETNIQVLKSRFTCIYLEDNPIIQARFSFATNPMRRNVYLISEKLIFFK